MSYTAINGKCPVCFGSSLEAASAPAGLARCESCSHVFAQQSPTAENRVFEGQAYRRWRQLNRSVFEERALDRARFLQPFLEAKAGRVFELGCGTGETLDALETLGWSAYGVDLSASSIEICRETYPRIDVAVGPGAEALDGVGENGFELVMAFHVAEHILDLADLSARLHDWCQPDGLLCLFVPNWDSWSRRLLGDNWPSVMPEHVHQFTPASMRRWLEGAGFKVETIKTDGKAWHWLGGIKRKISGSSAKALPDGKNTMPSRKVMLILGVAEIILRPFLWLEDRNLAGAEMRIIARRES